MSHSEGLARRRRDYPGQVRSAARRTPHGVAPRASRPSLRRNPVGVRRRGEHRRSRVCPPGAGQPFAMRRSRFAAGTRMAFALLNGDESTPLVPRSLRFPKMFTAVGRGAPCNIQWFSGTVCSATMNHSMRSAHARRQGMGLPVDSSTFERKNLYSQKTNRQQHCRRDRYQQFLHHSRSLAFPTFWTDKIPVTEIGPYPRRFACPGFSARFYSVHKWPMVTERTCTRSIFGGSSPHCLAAFSRDNTVCSSSVK